MSPTSQRILHIAIPSIISNITVPLLGLIDVTIVGHLGSASYIGSYSRRRHAVQYDLLDIEVSCGWEQAPARHKPTEHTI